MSETIEQALDRMRTWPSFRRASPPYDETTWHGRMNAFASRTSFSSEDIRFSDAFHAGEKSFANGEPVTSCERTGDERDFWIMGWLHAEGAQPCEP